jgi:hypothetical protein
LKELGKTGLKEKKQKGYIGIFPPCSKNEIISNRKTVNKIVSVAYRLLGTVAPSAKI